MHTAKPGWLEICSLPPNGPVCAHIGVEMATRKAFAFAKGPNSLAWVKVDPLLCLRQMVSVSAVTASLQVGLP
jgi:hypothetical protein